MSLFYQKNERLIAIIGASIVFLALMRTLAEPFRVQYLYGKVNYLTLKPLLIGALIAASGLFIITILSFYKKYALINIISTMAVILLLIVKGIFAIS